MFSNISKKASCFVFLLVALVLAASAAIAQVAQPDNNVKQAVGRSTSNVTASAMAERVRFTSPNTVVQLRLEVYDEAGQKLLDTEQRGGNVLDWHLQGDAGERVADGVYLCVLTIKNLSGRLSQKLGLVTVSGQSTVVRSAAVAELGLRQAQTVGPVESEGEGLVVKSAEDSQPVTVLANNGNEAQLARTRGALTFRVGDFFSGNDKEQMRLTEGGDLGIGTAKPKAKLDVAGMIRAREGLLFANGSALNVNDKGALTLTNSDGNVVPNTAGTGTLNRVAKWMETGGAGTLGDSLISESGGNVVVGNAGQTGNIQIFGPATQDVFAGMGPDVNNGPAFNYGYAGGSFGRSAGFFNVRPDAGATPPNPSLRFATANLQRMIVTNTGSVGIGTTLPGALLDVAGNINTSAQYNLGGNRILSNPGIQNLFAGVGAGQNAGQGSGNSFFGNNAGQFNTTGAQNSFFGLAAGQANTSSSSNSFFGTFAGAATTGNANSFFGNEAGTANQAGGINSFFGFFSGQSNGSGNYNTTMGAEADVGSGNLDHATAIGAQAVVSSSNTIALGRADGSDIVDVPGKLQIDTMAATGGQALCLNGSNRVALCTSSSLRYKTQVHSFLGGLNIVRRLRPITFTWKEDGSRDLGLGAEEVERVEPLLTFRNKRGEIEGVKYNQLSAVLINAVKEQQQQITQQQAAAKQQQEQIAALRAANGELNTRLRLIERTLKNKRGPTRHRR